MDISRRWFLGGAAAFGAFGGCRFFESNNYRAGGKPALRFGVVSDIHIVVEDPLDDSNDGRSCKTLRHAFEWFRDQGVDAVVIAGDMADNGLVSQLEAVAATWRDVFPDDRAPDGRHVERVFVYGNHDMGGPNYLGRRSLRKQPASLVDQYIIYPDPKTAWERTFDEPYEPIYRKIINGYSFVGAQWLTMGCRGADERFNDGIEAFYRQHAAELDPQLPFFHIQHPHPKYTCYGEWAWGHDIGNSTKALSQLPNAIAFSGHSHYSLTDERSLWQGAFTSVGTSSLRYIGHPYNELSEFGYANTTAWGPRSRELNAAKFTPSIDLGMCRQGMLWSVYEDCIVVRRREFVTDLDLGPDWVMPLPAAESKPFAFAAHAKKFGVPQFAEGATLIVSKTTAKNRGAKARGKQPAIKSVAQPAFEIQIPATIANPNARVYAYEVAALAKNGEVRCKQRVLASGFCHPLSNATAIAQRKTVCVVAAADCPAGYFTLTVTPLNCFGKVGKPISTAVVV